MNNTLALLVRDQAGLCYYCNRRFAPRHDGREHKLAPTIDHKKPLWEGGERQAPNLCAACLECNGLKGAMGEATFKRVRDNPELLRLAHRAASMRADLFATQGGWMPIGQALPEWRK